MSEKYERASCPEADEEKRQLVTPSQSSFFCGRGQSKACWIAFGVTQAAALGLGFGLGFGFHSLGMGLVPAIILELLSLCCLPKGDTSGADFGEAITPMV